MNMPVPSSLSLASVRRLSLLTAATLVPLWGTPLVLAQHPDGVIFVEDIEDQVSRQHSTGPWDPASPRRTAAATPQAMGPALPMRGGTSPAQRPPQYPTPQVNGRVASAPQVASLPEEEEKTSWREKFSFPNPFSKLFGSPKNSAAEERVAQRTPPRPAPSAGLQQRTQGARTQAGATTTTNSTQLAGHTATPRPHNPAQSGSRYPGANPFNGERPMPVQPHAGMPIAAAPAGQPTGRAATNVASSAPASRPLQEPTVPQTTDLDGVVMVSDLDDQVLDRLPSIEGPATRSQGPLPQVVHTPAPRTTTVPPPQHGDAVAGSPRFRSPERLESREMELGGMQVVGPNEAPIGAGTVANAAAEQPLPHDASEQIVNNHVQLATATTTGPQPYPHTMSGRERPTPTGDQAARARRAMPNSGPLAVENPVTPQGIESRPSREKAIELLTRASQLSQTASNEEEYTQVLQLCRGALAIDASDNVKRYSNELAAWAFNRRGEVKADRGQSQEALLDFEDALKLDPNRWRAIHNRGVMAAQQGQFAEAFDDFNRTLELNPKFAKAYSNRAALFVQAGDLQSALDDYQQAITHDPELAIAHKGRAKVCHLLGDFEGALRHFDAAILLAPQDATIVNYRGDLQCDIGRYSDAARSYREAIELDPNLVDAYRNLSWLAATCPNQELRNPQAAIALANKMMELTAEPGDLEYDTLAAAHAISGDYPQAIELMDKAIELSPPEGVANYQWRRQLYEQGRPYITEPAGSPEGASDAR